MGDATTTLTDAVSLLPNFGLPADEEVFAVVARCERCHLKCPAQRFTVPQLSLKINITKKS
ncbi:hypothetical protein Lferr_2386 [Acidithiobacillus ferrooxidans ATCC 53993]|jgi:hypothetical protein|nr:hypothetical protein Lferr_2386 [Acidithiobacillus ferrooxidans ATCC 53993]